MLVFFDGKKLQSIRKTKKITQAELAARADTSIRYIRDMEKGVKTNPSALLLFRLCSVMEIPMEVMITANSEID